MREERPLIDTRTDPPVFAGSTATVAGLFDALVAGHTVAHFLATSPGVTEEQVNAVLRMAREALIRSLRRPELWRQ